MGISADVFILTKTPRMGDSYTIFVKEQFEVNLIKRLEEEYGEFEVLHGKEMCYVGSGEVFKDTVLKDYKINEGSFTLEEGFNFIKEDEDKNRIKKYLEDIFNCDLKYIFEKKSIILSLNY